MRYRTNITQNILLHIVLVQAPLSFLVCEMIVKIVLHFLLTFYDPFPKLDFLSLYVAVAEGTRRETRENVFERIAIFQIGPSYVCAVILL